MTKHGGASRLDVIGTSHGEFPDETGTAYRNLFGPVDRRQKYTGLASARKNRRLFRWLVTQRMRSPNPRWLGGEPNNPGIPAGYTYFAQLVSHDCVHSLAPISDLGETGIWRRNVRSSRLMLDTIYGGGPEAFPQGYVTDVDRWGAPGEHRTRLRLGRTRQGDGPPSWKADTARDLPRVGCPYVEDRRSDRPALGQAPQVCPHGSPDVLIADSRNDDNLILSQMAVLFHLLHNWVYTQLERAEAKTPIHRRFIDARKVVTLIYRSIVFDDYLGRLLHPEIWRAYNAIYARCSATPDVDPYREAWPRGFIEQADDSRMPLEFSHAAGRLGHVMVRGGYRLNDEEGDGIHPLSQVLRQNSSRRPLWMPLSHDWLVDWSHFFRNAERADNVTMSRKLGPSYARQLIDQFFDLDDDPTRRDPVERGGLPYLDFLRGAEDGVRSVRSIIDNLPREVLALSPMVRQRGGRAGKWEADPDRIDAWLGAPPGPSEPDGDPIAEFRASIRDDPPLILFLLLEAELTEYGVRGDPDRRENGECLGAIGSAILAEFFFQERWRTHHLIEGDARIVGLSARLLEKEPPWDMPALIDRIAGHQGWDHERHKFW